MNKLLGAVLPILWFAAALSCQANEKQRPALRKSLFATQNQVPNEKLFTENSSAADIWNKYVPYPTNQAGDWNEIKNASALFFGSAGIKDQKKALQIFEKYAASYSGAACNAAAQYYLGQGASVDYSKTKMYAELAVKAPNKVPVPGCGEATLYLLYRSGQGVSQDETRAFEWLQKAVDAGNVKALHDLGVRYFDGRGVARDCSKAFDYASKSALKNVPQSIVFLAILYYQGCGVDRDIDNALDLWKRVPLMAGVDDVTSGSAYYNTGLVFYEGKDRPKDVGEAVKWWKRALDKKNADAAAAIAYAVQQGEWTESGSDPAKLYERAASQNLPEAAVNLGTMYITGKGVRASDREALRWFHKAADAGSAAAQTKLGIMYLEGRGVAKDERVAFTLFRRAADQNFAPGLFMTANALESGRGTDKNPIQALAFRSKIPKGDPLSENSPTVILEQTIVVIRLTLRNGNLLGSSLSPAEVSSIYPNQAR